MKDAIYKRCKCRSEDGKELGPRCPKLRRTDGSWNPRHGTWYYTLDLPAGAGGKRKRMRRGGFATREEAQADRDQAKAKIRKGADPSSRLTVGEYLTRWLEGRLDLKRTTQRNYRMSIGTYLVPLLGHIELSRLRPTDITEAFATIRSWNEELAAGRPVRKYQRHVGPAALQRIRGVLRAALNAAVDAGIGLDFNPATRVRMEPEKRRKPVAWTQERETAFWAAYKKQLAQMPPGGRGDRAFLVWRTMSLRPAPVMVWTPVHAGRFLDYVSRHRLSALYELIAATGVRRGEACGLPWPDVDLEAAQLFVGIERVQVGWEVVEDDPKSEAGKRPVALDKDTVAALRSHRKRQLQERLAWGEDWTDSGKVFTHEDGTPLHPDYVTDLFERLAFALGLPPIRLHDLRHGHASYALAAGVDIKVVQERLGHSTERLTRDTYTTVLDEVARAAAEAVAAMIPRQKAQ